MKILALELSSSLGSIAVLRDQVVLRAMDWPNDRRDSAKFFEALNLIARDFGPADKIVVGVGPGSYAGTRIAISAAIGLQIAWKAELIGYPSICALDVSDSDFRVIGDARRQSFFAARILERTIVEGPMLCTRDEMETRLASMDSATAMYSSEKLGLSTAIPTAFPNAIRLGEMAAADNPGVVAIPLQPMYLRDPHITEAKPKTLRTQNR